MTRRIYGTIAAICILLTAAACSQDEPNSSSRDRDRDTERPTRAASTRVIDQAPPSQPTATLQRTNFQATPTSPPPQVYGDRNEPTRTPSPTTTPITSDWKNNDSTAQDPHAHLIPGNPEFNDEVHLKEVYQHVDFAQFALDPNQGIDWIINHNCQYIEYPSVYDNQGKLTLADTINGICEPETADIRHYPLYYRILPGYLHEKHQRPYAFHHLVFNTSPIETIANHPYRFAFRNTHLWAKHTNDEQNIRFAANHVGTKPITTKQDGRTIVNHPGQQLIAIEAWLNQAWYRPKSGPPIVLPRQSITGQLFHTVTGLLERADEAKDDGLVIAVPHYISHQRDRNEAIRKRQRHLHPHLKNYLASNGSNLQRKPVVQWEFVSPTLPIVRVTTYFEQNLPYLPPGEDLDFWKGTDYYDDEVTDQELTRYAVSFVVAFQQRWPQFNHPDRIESYKPTTWNTLPPCGTTANQPCSNQRPKTHQSDDTLTADIVNRWYATDMMQHSIIGPVVVEVYESPVLQEGIYYDTPKQTFWDGVLPPLPDEYRFPGKPTQYSYRTTRNSPTETAIRSLRSMDSPDQWGNSTTYGGHVTPYFSNPLPWDFFPQPDKRVDPGDLHQKCNNGDYAECLEASKQHINRIVTVLNEALVWESLD